jgi:pantetheine-phosphate adenylyltransferase
MAAVQRVGVYPGTFDPVTHGHMDIITRAGRVVDRLVVAVAINEGKGPLFPLAERVAMLREEIDHIAEPGVARRIAIEPFEGLLVDFVSSVGGDIVVRGLRAVSDFEYEFQMSSLNAHLNPGIETIFLMASAHHQFISSRFIREISKLGGDVGPFVSPRVQTRLQKRFAKP